MIIAITEPGRIFALHSHDGYIIWSKFYTELIGNSKPKFHLFKTHSTRKLEKSPSIDVVILKASETVLARVNAIDGSIASHTKLPHQVESVFLHPSATSTHLHPLILIDTHNKVFYSYY